MSTSCEKEGAEAPYNHALGITPRSAPMLTTATETLARAASMLLVLIVITMLVSAVVYA